MSRHLPATLLLSTARVSSEKQAEKDLSIPAQLKQMQQHCAKKGWHVVSEYIDQAESARTANRPEFQRMIGAAKSKQKPFDAILVWKLSRFARNRQDSAIYKSLLKKKLNDAGLRTRRNQLWTKNTMLYTLRNEIYTGTYVWNKKKLRPKQRDDDGIIRVPDAVPALISREVFESIQVQLNSRAPSAVHPRTVSSPYLLAGLLRCSPCDRVMQGGTAKSGQYRYYACYTRL